MIKLQKYLFKDVDGVENYYVLANEAKTFINKRVSELEKQYANLLAEKVDKIKGLEDNMFRYVEEVTEAQKQVKKLEEILEKIMALKNNPLTRNQLELLQIIIKIAQETLKKEDKE